VRIYPLACPVAIAGCAFAAAGNDRFTAVGQWVKRASQADLARLRTPWEPPRRRYRAPDEKTIRVVLDRLDPRARALPGLEPGRHSGGPPASVRGYRARRAAQQAQLLARSRLRAWRWTARPPAEPAASTAPGSAYPAPRITAGTCWPASRSASNTTRPATSPSSWMCGGSGAL
jgi:hypothetical protein